MTDYITEQEFIDYIKSSAPLGNTVTQGAIAAASRAAEAYTGRVYYTRTATLYYSVANINEVCVEIDDLATTSGLLVKTDTSHDGSYATTLTLNTDFILEPRNQTFGGLPGWPYTQLNGLAYGKFPARLYQFQHETIQITGTFGWSAVPDGVKQATKIIAAMYYKLAEAPFGVAGWGAYGEIRVRDIPQAATLLAPYRKSTTFGIA